MFGAQSKEGTTRADLYSSIPRLPLEGFARLNGDVSTHRSHEQLNV